MLRKNQRRMCYFLISILLMAGIHTTYVKADNFAERAASIEAARIYTANRDTAPVTHLRGADRNVQTDACVVENVNPLVRTVLGRTTSRNISIRRDLRFAGVILWAFCVACFLLRCTQITEILYLIEKKYRAALIKYIHDIDGKKRISCLT